MKVVQSWLSLMSSAYVEGSSSKFALEIDFEIKRMFLLVVYPI